jgi:hypothetical protein
LMASNPTSLAPIERIQDFELPPEAEAVFDHLNEDGAARFGREIVQALVMVQAKGDFRPVLDVVEAWYRTLLMRQHPDYEEMVRWVRHGGSGETYPAEKVVARFSD